MTSDRPTLTATDRRLLAALDRTPNLVRAARAIGVPRDRAVYRLERLRRLFGPVTVTVRGGAAGGGTQLTAAGRRLLARALGPPPSANRWTGRYRRGPPPTVELAPGCALVVGFRAADGARVTVDVAPEAFVIARRPAELSARNALPATVERVRPRADGTAGLDVRWGPVRVRAELTVPSIARLGLAPGRRVILYAKAVGVRRVATPGSPRS
ncbi:MAG TPA: TOBE domain-containing protein [Thermoplasmata archaeon]|nr:TOBE domain-containing protein [Thermoplasmata archaeon]